MLAERQVAALVLVNGGKAELPTFDGEHARLDEALALPPGASADGRVLSDRDRAMRAALGV